MKKLILIILALCTVLSLTACGPADSNQTDATETTGTKVPGDYKTALSFTYNGTKIQLHAPAEPILAALGEAKAYTEEPSCAFDDGMDKTYTYDDFYLQTYPLNGKDYVYSFWFASDMVKTDEGIKIGDSQQAVEAAYGADAYNGRNAYIVRKDDGELSVILKDGEVTGITFAVVIG